MKNATPLEPTSANTFHAGNTCPHCQETIAVGQLIVTCPQCGSIHHESCWLHKPGCASYHCDRSVRSEVGNARPDITINAEELKNVQVPAARPRRPAQEIAERFLPKKPERISRLAIVGIIIGAFSLMGMLGVLRGDARIMCLGIVLALGALVLGVIAMVVINNPENRVSGFPVAGAAIVLPAVFIVVYFTCLDTQIQRSWSQKRADLKISESLPTEEQLARLTPDKANAMRANVVIKYEAGLIGAATYGSGVIVRYLEHRAYILTNKHVVGDGKPGGTIDVVFYNGEQSVAKIEWNAPGDVDIAVISCQALSLDKYRPIRLAEELVAVGERAFAIGNPMGLSWSYTEGTISGLRTSLKDKAGIDLYQTQTPINSGNSGGGLYSSDGKLIGINTWTEDKSVAEALNFAIATTGLLRLLPPPERERFLAPAPDHNAAPAEKGFDL